MVKGSTPTKRAYDVSGRRVQAARRRQAIIDAAATRFLRDGYVTTTIAAIAADAGVSDHTIYKSFGGKPGLIRAIRGQALEGVETVPAEQRSDDLRGDGHAIIEGWGRLTEEVMPRVAPILLLIRDAAITDPAVRELMAEIDDDRLRRMTHNAHRLNAEGFLRPGLSVAEAADVLWTYSAPELYELVVLRRGWSTRRYATMLTRAIIGEVL